MISCDHLDGRFGYYTKYFLQLFSLIHVIENGHYISVVFWLLSNKLEPTYKKLFVVSKEKCSEFNLVFDWNMLWPITKRQFIIQFSFYGKNPTWLLCRLYLGQTSGLGRYVVLVVYSRKIWHNINIYFKRMTLGSM